MNLPNIIKAKMAHKLTEEASMNDEKLSKELNYIYQQMIKAINKGKYEVELKPRTISNKSIDVLKALGYDVAYCMYLNIVTISWKFPRE